VRPVSDVRRPSRRATALTGLTALGLAGAAVLGVGLSDAAPVAVAVADTPVPPVAAPSTVVPTTESPRTTTPPAHTTPSSAVHVRVPAVDLDLPVLPLAARRGVIEPPLLTAAYWIEPYGRPVGSAEQADNTLYLAAHSAGRGSDGFDPLLDRESGSRLVAGDQVEVSTPEGTVTYTVDRTATYDKAHLAEAADVWAAVPGRLVMITCVSPGGGRAAAENLVVFAHS
jgi:sortase (surface protein transpeptidase)